MKIQLYTDSAHTQLTSAQGIPVELGVLPTETATVADVTAFNINRVLHVAPTTGNKNHVHIYANTDVTADVFIHVVSASDMSIDASTGSSRTIINAWPDPTEALKLSVRGDQSAPQVLLQGYTISAGAAISAYASAPGVTIFGYAVE